MYLAKRKNANYFIEYYDQFENRIRRITTKTKIKKEALKFLSEFQSNLASRKTKIEFTSLQRFGNEYIDFIGNTHSKSYQRSIKLSFKKLIEYTDKEVPLKQISVRIVQQFISETFERSNHAAHLYFRTLKAGFNRAVEWGYLTENPFSKVKLPRSTKTFPIFISESELERILSNLKHSSLKDLFTLAFFTGMRLAEITNLRWSAVDMTTRAITVRNSKQFTTKNKKERIIPINQKLLSVLSNRIPKIVSINNDEHIFQRIKGTKFNEDYVSKEFKKAVRAAELDDRIHFHTLRHSFASNLVQRGASIYVVKELLGHEDISTTQIYSHLQTENLTKAVDLL